jgi:prevent-host-death family protein
MQCIGTYELKTHLSEVLDAVEHGQTVIVTRHGKPIARILPSDAAEREQVSQAVQSLLSFPRTRLPKGVTIRSLIEQGRR